MLAARSPFGLRQFCHNPRPAFVWPIANLGFPRNCGSVARGICDTRRESLAGRSGCWPSSAPIHRPTRHMHSQHRRSHRSDAGKGGHPVKVGGPLPRGCNSVLCEERQPSLMGTSFGGFGRYLPKQRKSAGNQQAFLSSSAFSQQFGCQLKRERFDASLNDEIAFSTSVIARRCDAQSYLKQL